MIYNFFRSLTPMARVLALATVAALVLGHSHVHAGLVARWTLDDNGADTTVLSDFNSPADDGTLRHIGDPAGVTTADHSVPGQIGGALNFDGITDKVTTGFAGPSGADPRSVSMWVKGSKIDQNGFPQILAWGGFPGNNGGAQGARWSIRIKDPGGDGTGPWAARIEVNNGGMNGTIDVLDDQWNNIIATWDGTDAKIYVNGTFDGSKALPINTATDFNVSIGFAESFDDESFQRFKGQIDEVRIYDHALSQSEIDALQIPEPTSFVLAALGLLGVGAFRRQR